MIKKNNSLSFLFPIFFLILSILMVSLHEMWRDELQAWMLSRDSVSIKELFLNLKYEGHPGLWHLMLFPITRIFDYPSAMQYFHVLIATGSVFLIFKFSPFSTIQKILLSFGYFLFYEYSIIARNYGIGVFFIFILCSLFPKRYDYLITYGIIIFLLSHTSVFGLIFAICFLLTILFEKNLTTKTEFFRQHFFKFTLFKVIAIFGIITAIIQLIPPNDSGFANEWYFHFNFYGFKSVASALIGSYFPIPNFSLNFWDSRPLFLTSENIALVSIFFAISIVWVLAKYLMERPSAFFLYLSATASYLSFFYIKLPGDLRHHGFLFITLISALWIYPYCHKQKFFNITNSLIKTTKRNLNYLLNVFFSIHVLAAVVAIIIDYKHPFSSAKETAKFIYQNGLSEAQIIGHTSPPASAVAGYLNKKKIYYIEVDKYGTFIKWDNSQKKKVNLKHLVSKSYEFTSKDKKKNLILLLNQEIEKYGNEKHLFKKIFESQNATVRNEKFYLYSLILPSIKKE